jgi:3',5'-cyclic AMP phosphodiesterase CpdA
VITLAHLSDPHLDGGTRNAGRLAHVIGYLTSLPGSVDAVLITGDITDSGSPQDYAVAADLTSRLSVPVVFCPGNHDVRDAFASALLGLDNQAGPINQVVEVAGVAIVLCDSTIPGQSAGELSSDTLHWLDRTLGSYPDRPVFVAMHHPPLSLGIPLLDGMKLGNPAELAAVLAQHSQVAGVLCGHAHSAAASTFAGLPLRVAPGLKSTTLLPFEVTGPDVMTLDLPPAFAVHCYDDGLLTTHYRAL